MDLASFNEIMICCYRISDESVVFPTKYWAEIRRPDDSRNKVGARGIGEQGVNAIEDLRGGSLAGSAVIYGVLRCVSGQ